LSCVSNAAPDDEQSIDQSRPKVAVVLGGGGAHGVVHLGVLEELERQRVPIDFLVGTGFGGIIGGLYASGMAVSDINEFLFDTDWDNVFDPDTGREDLSFRRKRDDADFLVKFSVGVKDGQAKLPIALVPSEKLAQLLQSAVAHTKGVNSFDDLPVPFRTVAMDLLTGSEVVLQSGALDKAMLATVSAPGTLAPVQINNRPLITGSLINNLPVDIARDMGADIIIVVDIGTYIRGADDLSSIFAIVDQVGHLFQVRNSEASLAALGSGDILIQPDVVAYKETDVTDPKATVEKGVQSVTALSQRFAGIRLDEQQYATFHAGRVERRSMDPIISRIDLVNDSEVDDAVILAQLRQSVNEPLDGVELEEDLRKIFGIGSFSSVDFSLLEEGNSTVLELTTVENQVGNRFWRFGIAMQDDFNGNSAYTASSSMTWTNLNAMGAEWRNVFRIGELQQLSTEFYQPLVRSGLYFLSAGGSYIERNVNIFSDGQILGQSRVRETTGLLKVGRIFGNAAQVTIGVLGGNGSTNSNIGPNVPSTSFDIGGLVATWAYDTYNNIYFPKRGTRASLSWVGQRESMGASFDIDIVEANLGSAKTWGDHTIIGGFTLESQLEDVPGAQNLVATGGFLQLSGFQTNELTGRHTAVGRAIYFRKLRSNPLRGFLDATLYVGGSLEIGNAWQNSSDVSLSDSLLAGSLFVGADTFIGPIYFAGGYAQGGKSALYLFVGRPY
jgi:NTE family protein